MKYFNIIIPLIFLSACLPMKVPEKSGAGNPMLILLLGGRPPAITDLTAVGVSGSRVRLNWTSVGGFAYDVRHSTLPITDDAGCEAANVFATTMAPAAPGNAQMLRVKKLQPNSLHYFCVRAVSGTAVGPWQSIVSATTLVPGTLISEFVVGGSGSLSCTAGLAWAPDGNLLVVSQGDRRIIKYDGTTGELIGDLITPGAPDGSSTYWGIRIGPNGHLYADGGGAGKVFEFDATSGAFIQIFIPGTASSAAYSQFGADGNYYRGEYFIGIVRYDGTTGTSLGTFSSGGGFSGPAGLVLGPDGQWYAFMNSPAPSIVRYDGTTGAYITDFGAAQLTGPNQSNGRDMIFGPNDHLFVSDYFGHKVEEFDAENGISIGTFAQIPLNIGPGSNVSEGLVFDEDGNLFAGHGCNMSPNDRVFKFVGP